MSKVVLVDLRELAVGRKLRHPIYDTGGVLLLNAGAVITLDAKKRMVRWGVSRVVVEESEAQSLTENALPKPDPEKDKEQLFAELEKTLDERLNELLGSGMAQIRNSGPALRGSVARHGKKPYDARRRETVEHQQCGNVDAVQQMMHEIHQGDHVNADCMHDVANNCVANLVADPENTLTVSFDLQTNSRIAQHSMQVATLAMALGVELGLDANNVRRLGVSATLADIGMLRVPAHIRDADRPLSPVEFVEIQKHPVHTANMLEPYRHLFSSMVQIIAYQVHERCDGTGYPRGRQKQSIHPFARIVHVADAYVAMISPRTHRPALMPYAAMRTLLWEAATGKVAVEAVRALLRVLSLFPIGSYVELSDGSLAQVLRPNGGHFSRPVVQRCRPDGTSAPEDDQEESVMNLCESELTIVRAVPTPGREELDVDPVTDVVEADFRSVFSGLAEPPSVADLEPPEADSPEEVVSECCPTG